MWRGFLYLGSCVLFYNKGTKRLQNKKKNNPGRARGKVVFVVAMLGESVPAGPDVTLTLKSMIHIRPGFDSPADREI